VDWGDKVKSRRITEITLETNEICTIRRDAGSRFVLCSQCEASAMVTVHEAAALFRVGVRAICREVEAGRLHFLESAGSSLLICLDSLRHSALLHSDNSTLPIKQICTQDKENPS
jgi:hypothetical protein